MFWRKKNKNDFQLYEEELDQIRNLVENKDDADEDSDYGDSILDLKGDESEGLDEIDIFEEEDSQDQDMPGQEDDLTEDDLEEPKKKKGFLKGLFKRSKKTTDNLPEDPMEDAMKEENPEAAGQERPDDQERELTKEVKEDSPQTAARESSDVQSSEKAPEDAEEYFPVYSTGEPEDENTGNAGTGALAGQKIQEDPEDHSVESEGQGDQGPGPASGNFGERVSVSGGSGFGDEEITYVDNAGKNLPLKKIIVAVIAAAAVLAIVLTFVFRNLNSGGEGKVYVSSVRQIMEYSGSSSGVLNRFTGVVASQDAWNISLDSNMTVAKCYVKVGQQVKVGDKLFKYNTDELKLNQEKLELDIQEKENANKTNKQTIEQSEKALKTAKASEKLELQTTILKAQAEIKRNELDIKQDKKEIKKMKKTIKNATVKSKIDGVVKSLNESLGQGSNEDSESESDNMAITDGSDNSYYMVILAIGDYRIEGKISEQNQSDISEGERVIVRSRIDNTQVWKGVISEIKTNTTAQDNTESDNYMTGEGSSGESSSYYNFYVELDSDEGLMMGQHVLIEEDNNQDVTRTGIWLNSTYLAQEDGDFYVWIANKNDKLEYKKVKVGDNYNPDLDEYEIVEGLEKSDYIANASQSGLKTGMSCVKVSAEQTFIQSTEMPGYETETSDGQDYEDDLGDIENIDQIENEEDLKQLEDDYQNYDGLDENVEFDGSDSVVEGDGPAGENGVVIDSGELNESPK